MLAAVLRFWLPALAFRRAAQRHLAAAWPQQAEAIWQATRRLQPGLVAARPRHSPGVNHVLRYLEWDRALYQAAQEQGLTAGQAGTLVEEISWSIFGPPIGFAFRLSRLRSAQRRVRVRWLLDLLFLTVFGAPFRREPRPEPGAVAFDVTTCPLADYLRAQGTPELTRHAACSLDYRMARDWGLRLDRSQTIAEGGRCCDFRFRMPHPEPR